MQLELRHVIPEPLKARMPGRHSDIWDRDMTFTSGRHVFLQAPSGKGKSTFIHILYGLRNDYEGEVLWNGTDIKTVKKEQLAQWRSREASIVFQDLRLFTDLTVEENLMIKYNLLHDVGIDKIKEWCAYLGLADKWQQKAETLSYGERQRVAIIRSLMQPFNCLLLDEPFSHLDNENISKAAGIIRERLEQRGAGLILADLEDNNWFHYDNKLSM